MHWLMYQSSPWGSFINRKPACCAGADAGADADADAGAGAGANAGADADAGADPFLCNSNNRQNPPLQ